MKNIFISMDVLAIAFTACKDEKKVESVAVAEEVAQTSEAPITTANDESLII